MMNFMKNPVNSYEKSCHPEQKVLNYPSYLKYYLTNDYTIIIIHWPFPFHN